MANAALRAEAGRAALAHVRSAFPLEREADELRAIYEDLWASG